MTSAVRDTRGASVLSWAIAGKHEDRQQETRERGLTFNRYLSLRRATSTDTQLVSVAVEVSVPATEPTPLVRRGPPSREAGAALPLRKADQEIQTSTIGKPP